MLLPVVLFMTAMTHPGIPPVQVGAYVSERACSLAAHDLAEPGPRLDALASAVGAKGRTHLHFTCRVNT